MDERFKPQKPELVEQMLIPEYALGVLLDQRGGLLVADDVDSRVWWVMAGSQK